MMSGRLPRLLLLLLAAVALVSVSILYAIRAVGEAPPRTLGYRIEQRIMPRDGPLADVGYAVARFIADADRLDQAEWHARSDLRQRPLVGIGAAGDDGKTAAQPAGRELLVSTPLQAEQAFEQAQPGDVITFLPGEYRFERTLEPRRGGTAQRPITVQARKQGTVKLLFATLEAFLVEHPYWIFRNLHLQGVCARHDQCDHGFHVSGPANHFMAIDNTVLDFNAHFKVNGLENRYPDHGIIRRNTIRNTTARHTAGSVNLVDIVAANGWLVSENLIADFVKTGGNKVSFGIYMKGAGSRNRIERNLVICHDRLPPAGQEVGLSLGGGGTGPAYCRDRRCITEQDDSVIESNLVLACSDVGIYLNRAAASQVTHNTLLDTAGIDLRFAETAANVQGNLVDGIIRTRDGALVDSHDNISTPLSHLYAGSHPVRALFGDVASLDLGWSGTPARTPAAAGMLDLCGQPRPSLAAYGAFEDFGACKGMRSP